MKNNHVRIIRRKYTSKKTGRTKIYEYKYDVYKVQGRTKHRSKRNVVYRGKLTKYGQEWVKEYSKGLDISDKNELAARVLSAERNHKTVSETSFKSMLSENRTARYIYNMGGDIDDISRELNVSERELVNEKNWDFNKNVLIIGNTMYQFYFDYKSHSMRWEIIG